MTDDIQDNLPESDAPANPSRRRFLRKGTKALVANPVLLAAGTLTGVGAGATAGAVKSDRSFEKTHPLTQQNQDEMHERAIKAAIKSNAEQGGILSERQIIDVYNKSMREQQAALKVEEDKYYSGAFSEVKKDALKGSIVGLAAGAIVGGALNYALAETPESEQGPKTDALNKERALARSPISRRR